MRELPDNFAKLRELFIKYLPKSYSNFKIEYVDLDKDTVMIGDDDDLYEAYKETRKSEN